VELTLGQRLKQWRKNAGFSQRKLSRVTGVRQALISELELGRKQDTTGVNLDALAKAFGKTVDQLMHGEHYDGDTEPAGAALVGSQHNTGSM
jgi:transcriptional regulator with XRE-family HTH domain